MQAIHPGTACKTSGCGLSLAWPCNLSRPKGFCLPCKGLYDVLLQQDTTAQGLRTTATPSPPSAHGASGKHGAPEVGKADGPWD